MSLNTDISSGVLPVGFSDIITSDGENTYVTSSGAGTYRGIGSDWFNAEKIAAEDWLRSEQSADLALKRSLIGADYQNSFNASEAQKQRDFEERMSSTAYQRAVQDMQKSGINPVLAFSQGGASTPSGSSASSGYITSSRANSGRGFSNQGSLGSLIGTLLNVVAGLYSSGASNATKLALSQVGSFTHNRYDDYGRLTNTWTTKNLNNK